MAVTYGFYNSVAGDRVYNAIQMTSLFDGVINDGVYAAIGDCFLVSPYSDMDIKIGTGRAWFNHTWTYNDADLVVTIATAHPLLSRYDSVILEVNESVDVRVNTIKVISGTPASNPSLPSLTNTETLHQYRLANILVEPGVTEIVQSKITNLVGQSGCPFVTGPLSVISVNSLIAQWEAEFHDWFDFVVDELSEEQFGNLQNQINQHDHSEVLNTQVVAAGIADASIDKTKVGVAVPKFVKRLGGSTSAWDEPGSTIYTIDTGVKMQGGSVAVTIQDGQSYGDTDYINFPEAYSVLPLFYVSVIQYYNAVNCNCLAISVSTSQFLVRVNRPSTSGIAVAWVQWLAIGPG